MVALLGVLLAISPFLLLVGGLYIARRIEWMRNEAAYRQVAVTDAIHRELGPIAAPVVERHGNGWDLVLPLAPGRPALTAKLLEVGYETFARFDPRGAASLRLVCVPASTESAEHAAAQR